MTAENRGTDEGEAFAADWLALREPVDHRSRNGELQTAVIDHLAALGRDLSILDLGCGTGSTLRALAPAIAERCPHIRQRWTLVDADEGLLARARAEIAGSDDRLAVECRAADLADRAMLEALMADARPDLVTGSALIDLVSSKWLEALADIAERNRSALLFALNYTGEESWTPPHPLDAAVLAAFNADQRRDKGFGPAMGGEAAGHLAMALATRPFKVLTGASDWHLGRQDQVLITMLSTGIATAAARTGRVEAPAASAWASVRMAADRVVVGHTDIAALPLA
jgi:SAM-dependent methyltransferase